MKLSIPDSLRISCMFGVVSGARATPVTMLTLITHGLRLDGHERGHGLLLTPGPDDPHGRLLASDVASLAPTPLVVLAVASVYFGVSTEYTAAIAFDAARVLVDGSVK